MIKKELLRLMILQHLNCWLSCLRVYKCVIISRELLILFLRVIRSEIMVQGLRATEESMLMLVLGSFKLLHNVHVIPFFVSKFLISLYRID